jgi:serine/threonine protein kinase
MNKCLSGDPSKRPSFDEVDFFWRDTELPIPAIDRRGSIISKSGSNPLSNLADLKDEVEEEDIVEGPRDSTSRRASEGATDLEARVKFSVKWAERVRAWEVTNAEIELGGPLGSGGQGQVLEAWVHGHRCAAKKLTITTNLQHEEAARTLQREVKALSQLHHPNIIRLLHVCTERNHLCVLVELADKGNLDQVLEDHPQLSDARIFYLLHGVVLGMTVLHAHKPRPILHNDLKPANVLVNREWTSKVADFGSATGFNTTATATTHNIGGTLRYQAPEVLDASGGDGSITADVYSFGITMYETVTRTKAWEGKRESQILALVLRGERPVIPTDCHTFYRNVIERCWSQEVLLRPSFSDLRTMFDKARAAHQSFRVDMVEHSTLSVVISSPTMSLNGENVMMMVEALCKTRTDVIFGYDWAGSNSADDRDKHIDWSKPESVAQSFWFKGYCERAKGLITGLVQQGHALTLLCIEGGPISQLEARSMENIQTQILDDLSSKGITDASIRSSTMTFDAFKRNFGGALAVANVAAPGATMYPLSTNTTSTSSEYEVEQSRSLVGWQNVAKTLKGRHATIRSTASGQQQLVLSKTDSGNSETCYSLALGSFVSTANQ